ncbi:hypothetical protein ACFQMM_02580 [Saliphagus sp. GCM10025308]
MYAEVEDLTFVGDFIGERFDFLALVLRPMSSSLPLDLRIQTSALLIVLVLFFAFVELDLDDSGVGVNAPPEFEVFAGGAPLIIRICFGMVDATEDWPRGQALVL